MITPQFKLSQDTDFITIEIRAPYCSLRELDIDVDNNVFLFVCKPYYLRLTFPGNILEDERMKSSFDTNSGEFSFSFAKENPGEHFKNLELITKFLTPKVEAKYNDGSMPIELLSVSNTNAISKESGLKSESEEYGFGFALRTHNKDFVSISSEFSEVFEVNPWEVTLKERSQLRFKVEQGRFNADHYLADLIDNSEICDIISQKSNCFDVKSNGDFKFTDKELAFLKDLPNIEYNLCPERINYCHNGLIDILYAYCYDQRTTFYEGSVESSWTVAKLASTLCWLDGFQLPKEALISAYRRSMIYPLYRHFELAQTVFEDLKVLIQLEDKYIIKVLIQLYDIFLYGDCSRYILNNLFIKDYIIYIMKWDQDLWKAKVKEILSIDIKKDDLGLNLTQIEEEFFINQKLSSLHLRECESDSDDSDSSDDNSSNDSSSSSCSTCSDSDSNDFTGVHP